MGPGRLEVLLAQVTHVKSDFELPRFVMFLRYLSFFPFSSSECFIGRQTDGAFTARVRPGSGRAETVRLRIIIKEGILRVAWGRIQYQSGEAEADLPDRAWMSIMWDGVYVT